MKKTKHWPCFNSAASVWEILKSFCSEVTKTEIFLLLAKETKF